MSTARRAPHAVLEPESRRRKARKIATMLAEERPLAGLRVLDVGTGSGVIAARLAEAVGEHGEVHAVDVVDIRIEKAGYEFHLIDGVLPFDDASFDVVVSNHCIEHTGRWPEQEQHMRELACVLKRDGNGYFTTPNRWAPIETHFKLFGLSYLPTVEMQSRYVRLAGKGERYDCRLLTRPEIRRLFATAGLDPEERTLDAMRVMGDVEDPSLGFRTLLRAPDWLLRAGFGVVPTLVFTFRHPTFRDPQAPA